MLAFHPGTVSKGLIAAALSADMEELVDAFADWLSCLLSSAPCQHLHWLPFFSQLISPLVVLRVLLFSLYLPLRPPCMHFVAQLLT